MGQGKRISLLQGTQFFFLQGKDFPLETVAGAFKAKKQTKKTDGGSCMFLRLFLART